MVEPHRAPRQWGCPRTGGQHRLVLLGLILLLVSAGAGVGIALPRLSDSSTRGPVAAAPQGIQMQPVPAEAVVVGTSHVLTFQLTDADGNPMQEAGRSVQVVIIEAPPPRQADSRLASVDPTVMITNANGQATTTLTVGYTSGSIRLGVITDTRAEFVLSALPDRASERLVEVSGNNQVAAPGEELEEPLVVRVEDQFGNPIESEPVVFARLVGDGEFVDANAVASRRHIRGSTERLGLARPRQTVPPVVSVIVSTDPEGKASVRYRPGEEALQVVSAQAQLAPNDPVIFRINLGPLAGNGTQPINIAVGGGRGYTANSGTNNISVFDATGTSDTVVGVIDLKLVQTSFGAGGISGVAVDALANRLYIYAGVATSVYGASVVLLVVDTATNELVGPIDPNGGGFPDPDGDGWPGLTLFITPEPPSRLLDTGNFVTVDATRHRVYAVVPVRDDNGRLIVIEDRGDALAIVGRVPVGELPSGVAVNPRTNRIYVTNGGFDLSDASNDTVTVINGADFTVIDTITVGRGPLGVKVDDIHDVIYVANFFGEETLESAGALSVINGETHTVIQTIPTAGITDLAVLVGVETDLLDDAIDRIYVSDSRIIDCNITDLTVPTPCQVYPDDSDFGGRLAINDTRTLLFGAYRYDNSVTVFDVATNTKKADIFTGVSARGLAVDTQTGSTYVSDFSTRGRLFVIDREGKSTGIDLSTLGVAFGVPGQVEVDETNGRIYIISPNSLGGAAGISPFIALDRATWELGVVLEPDEWTFGWPGTLGIDEGRNLLYLSASSSISHRLLVFDGAKFFGNTRVNDALVANIVIGLENGTELAGGVAVDAERNLIYVTNCGFSGGCDPSRNALVVVQGPELDEATRTVLRAPAVITEVPGIGLNYGGGRHDIALDLESNVIYVAGAFGSVGAGEGFGGTDITVLDGFKIVNEQGQVMPNPAAAILGIIPIKILGNLDIPITSDFGSSEMAFNAAKRLLYVVTDSAAPFSEGFISVINSDLVINANREFNRAPHRDEPETLMSLIATLPAGIDPKFIALDAANSRVMVTNQSLGALSVLQGLTVR